LAVAAQMRFSLTLCIHWLLTKAQGVLDSMSPGATTRRWPQRAKRDVFARENALVFDSSQFRRSTLSPRLRSAYGMRLVKEPILSREKVTHKIPLRGPSDVYSFMLPFVAQESAESFWGLPLDAQYRCEAPVVITRGILTASVVHARELFRAMICANAAGIVLCHNHPGNDPTPSGEDRAVTRMLVAAGALLDIPVLDHIIVTTDNYFSFADAGLLTT
jgi:RadC-like JAB domain-containing protein